MNHLWILNKSPSSFAILKFLIYLTYLNFWPPHSRSGGRQGPETFLALSADRQTEELEIRLQFYNRYKLDGVITIYHLHALSFSFWTKSLMKQILSLSVSVTRMIAARSLILWSQSICDNRLYGRTQTDTEWKINKQFGMSRLLRNLISRSVCLARN